jgi:hypothetical protein
VLWCGGVCLCGYVIGWLVFPPVCPGLAFGGDFHERAFLVGGGLAGWVAGWSLGKNCTKTSDKSKLVACGQFGTIYERTKLLLKAHWLFFTLAVECACCCGLRACPASHLPLSFIESADRYVRLRTQKRQSTTQHYGAPTSVQSFISFIHPFHPHRVSPSQLLTHFDHARENIHQSVKAERRTCNKVTRHGCADALCRGWH